MSQGNYGNDQVEITLLREYFLTTGPFPGKSNDRILQQSEIDSTHFTLVVDIPRQVRSLEEIQKLNSVGKTLENIVTGQIVISLALSFLLKGVMSQMWPLLNTMQILTILPLFATKMPANVL